MSNCSLVKYVWTFRLSFSHLYCSICFLLFKKICSTAEKVLLLKSVQTIEHVLRHSSTRQLWAPYLLMWVDSEHTTIRTCSGTITRQTSFFFVGFLYEHKEIFYRNVSGVRCSSIQIKGFVRQLVYHTYLFSLALSRSFHGSSLAGRKFVTLPHEHNIRSSRGTYLIVCIGL